MTPSDLRDAIERGEWTCTINPRRPPEPPPELHERSRNRIRIGTRFAMLFIMERKTWWQAVDKVRIEGLAIGDTMSRQRVTQYAKVGLKFLMDRGVFEQVYKKPATPTKKRK